MGRIISLGIQSAGAPSTVFGTSADRPSSVNAGVTFYNHTTNQLEIFNGSAWAPINDYERVSINSNTSATANKTYWVDTSGSSVTITLPSSPNPGDFIKVTDVSGTFGTNNCTIDPNGNRIMRQADSMTISTNGASVRMVYHSSGAGWLLEAI